MPSPFGRKEPCVSTNADMWTGQQFCGSLKGEEGRGVVCVSPLEVLDLYPAAG